MTSTALTAPIVRETAIRRDLKAPIALDVFALVTLVLAFVAPRPGASTFMLSTGSDLIQIPPVSAPSTVIVTVIAVLLVILAVLAHLYSARGATGKVPLWLIAVFGVLFLVAFLKTRGAANGSRL
jgi:simple sugar transport system permease protein